MMLVWVDVIECCLLKRMSVWFVFSECRLIVVMFVSLLLSELEELDEVELFFIEGSRFMKLVIFGGVFV